MLPLVEKNQASYEGSKFSVDILSLNFKRLRFITTLETLALGDGCGSCASETDSASQNGNHVPTWKTSDREFFAVAR